MEFLEIFDGNSYMNLTKKKETETNELLKQFNTDNLLKSFSYDVKYTVNYNKNNKLVLTDADDNLDDNLLDIDIECPLYYKQKINGILYKMRPLRLIKNFVSLKRDYTISTFLKKNSLILNRDDINNFVRENKYFSVIYEVEKIDIEATKRKIEINVKLLKRFNETREDFYKKNGYYETLREIKHEDIFNGESDESVSDEDVNINLEKLKKINERLKLKKKKYRQKKKNKQVTENETIEPVEQTEETETEETDETDETDETEDTDFYYVKILFKHTIEDRIRLRNMTYNLINQSKPYNKYLRDNGIRFIKIIKGIHMDINRQIETLHYNIIELSDLSEMETAPVKHLYLKNNRVSHITELKIMEC